MRSAAVLFYHWCGEHGGREQEPKNLPSVLEHSSHRVMHGTCDKTVLHTA